MFAPLLLAPRKPSPSSMRPHAPCVCMHRQRQETSRQVMEGKDAKSIQKRHKIDECDRDGKHSRKVSKQA